MTLNKIDSKRFSIRIIVANMFLIAIVITAAVAILLQYNNSKKMAIDHMLSSINLISNQMGNGMNQVELDARRTVNLLADLISSDLAQTSIERKSSLLSHLLQNRPNFYSLYIGDKRENFFQLINLAASAKIRQRMQANADDQWVVSIINDGVNGRQRHTYYYSSTFHLNHQDTQKSNFYPTERPWFAASTSNGVHQTKPYLFQPLQETGQTYSKRIRNTDQVIGLDILLSSVSEELNTSSKQLNVDDVKSFLFQQNGNVIASNLNTTHSIALPDVPPLSLNQEQQNTIKQRGNLKVSNQNDWRPFDFNESGLPQGYFIGLMQLISAKTGLQFNYINGFSRNELIEKYQNKEIDLLLSVQKDATTSLSGELSLPLLSIPYGIAMRNDTLAPTKLADLNGKTVGYLGSWSVLPQLEKRFPKINWQEALTIQQLMSNLEKGQVDAVIGAALVLESTINNMTLKDIQVDTTVADLNQIIPNEFYLLGHKKDAFAINLINTALRQITPEQRQALKTTWLENNTKSLQHYLNIPIQTLTNAVDSKSKKSFTISKAKDGTQYFVFIKPIGNDVTNKQYLALIVSEKALYEKAMKEAYQSTLLSALLMVLLLPIIWLFSTPIVRPIKQLQLETEKIKQRQFQDLTLANSHIKEVWQLSCSFQEMAQEIKQHEAMQKDFMEALIRLIADAIDNKSAHTGGHCHRVPELGLMLSDALEKAQDGPYKDFQFANDNERREFRIAAWLHDCGKITMPEHIMDKGSKLECNYNRIHEIRTRFEVLWRDAQIDYLSAVYIEKQDSDIALAQWKARQASLQEQFAFIAKANVGSESMNEEDKQKVKEIGGQAWTRHFNKQLGLSPAEDMLVTDKEQIGYQNGDKAEYLSIQDTLLSDKPEHIIPRLKKTDLAPSLGIKMDIPEHQYNLGEIYNLTIKSGTLTEEDRFKIKEHMISTITMLENLPFPPELSKVPHYASTHHERMDGQGYPRKLSADQLTIPDRILMIADVFEALTASDRPYKKANPLSTTIEIMHQMCEDGHLDKVMFRFFLESGTYMRYAERFLPESQRDEVDLKVYLDD